MKLEVQKFLENNSLNDLQNQHGIKYNISNNNKFCLNYDQLESSNDDVFTHECRGLVLRSIENIDEKTIVGNTSVVAFGLKRFFNLEQKEVAANIDWSSAVFEEKLDGTCVVVYFDYVLDKWCCGTRSRAEADGGIDGSDLTFAHLVDETCDHMWKASHPIELGGNHTLQDLMESICYNESSGSAKNKTFVFELTSPMNRIVCKYDSSFLTLLAVRDNRTLKEEDTLWWLSDDFALEKAKEYHFDDMNEMIEVVRSWSPEEHEGVVVRDKHYNRIKVKNPSYVAYNHMRDSLATSIKGCVEVILLGKEDDVIGMMPEPIANRINRLKPCIAEVLHRTQQDYDRIKDIDDMKYYASEAVLCLWPAALFALKRGKTPDLHTFALGNKKDVAKIPSNAVNAMIDLCTKIDPDVSRLDL